MSGDATFGGSTLPEPLEAQVRAELDAGEQLLWVGQPRPRRFLRQALPVVLFGIPFTAFAVFWMLIASGLLFGAKGGPGGAFVCFPLFGLPFLLVGLGMLTSPYWLGRRARRTFYAVTDRRAILWEPALFGGVTVRSYAPDQLTHMQRNQFPDGSGDLIFEEFYTYGNRGGRSLNQRGFFGIDRVRDVEELIRKALLRPPAAGPGG